MIERENIFFNKAWFVMMIRRCHELFRYCNEAIFPFVANEQNGAPVPVPTLIPVTEEEKKRYEGALRRRQLSLILEGRMKADDATELKALFTQD